jgi:hypothetical protein
VGGEQKKIQMNSVPPQIVCSRRVFRPGRGTENDSNDLDIDREF